MVFLLDDDVIKEKRKGQDRRQILLGTRKSTYYRRVYDGSL